MTISSICSGGVAATTDGDVRRERAEMATCCHGNGDEWRLGRVRREEREGRREEEGMCRVRIWKRRHTDMI